MQVGQYKVRYETTKPAVRWTATHQRTGETIRGESASKSGASAQILNEIAKRAHTLADK